MPTVIMIVVASVLVIGLLAAVWLQQRRTSRGSHGLDEAAATSAAQRQDDHQGWNG